MQETKQETKLESLTQDKLNEKQTSLDYVNFEYPKWTKEIIRFISVKPQIILEGNIYDVYPIEINIPLTNSQSVNQSVNQNINQNIN
ncbi:MAG: hypothetical protein ACPL1F_04620, partial [bacterium]